MTMTSSTIRCGPKTNIVTVTTATTVVMTTTILFLIMKSPSCVTTSFVINPSFTATGIKNNIMSTSTTTTVHQSSSTLFSNTPTISTDDSSRTVTKDDDDDDELLSLPARPGRPLRVMIAGGGVGGLTTALCLLKKGMDVTVYEKTGEFARFGGPIQFASNALSVLKAIDDTLFERIMDQFTFTGTRVCGIKDGLRANGSFRMTNDSFDYLFNKDAPADWFVKFPLKECADLFGLPYTGVIDRPDLQEILIDECKKIKHDFLINGSPIQSYENHGIGQGVTATLFDGSRTPTADVLIGSDGIWSSIRSQMYDEGPVKSSKNNNKNIRQGCPYSGYTVFAGETIIQTPDYYETGYKVYIGPKRYFVTSDVGDGRIQWYAFFALPPGTKKAPSGWGGSTRDDPANPEENLVEYIKGLHNGWSDEVMTILDSTSPDSVEQRDLYDRRPELFRSWADGNVVLIGDAVHAMMPNLGQGGCQAIEDAYVLSELLSTTSSTKQIPPTLQTFYKQRIVRVSVVQFLSKLASDLIINAFDTPWSPHDNLGTSWKSYLTFFWKPILQYMIFPAQFAYLYSYHPTGNIKSIAHSLEQQWKKKHYEQSEAVFAAANVVAASSGDDNDYDGKRQIISSSKKGPSFFQKAEIQPEMILLAAKKQQQQQ